MTISLKLPEKEGFKPRIAVFGVGGAGGNAVNNMITSNLMGVNFVVANTDAQALENTQAEQVIQLGGNLTSGLGAGASPDIGAAAAEESLSEILEHLENSNMAFITAGMGGGTGTGAAPVIAKAAREKGILTVGVVTKPFHFEGAHRMRVAELGVEELQAYVDTLIVIPNQNLFRVANEKTTFADAFRMADDVLHAGVRGVTDLIVMPGLINLDFADIKTVMSEMGKAMMGTGEATGEARAIEAAEAAISNPLLDNVTMKGARGVLINITGGMDMTLFEVDEAANRIREEVESEANIIFGSTFNPELDGTLRVSVIATGIDSDMVASQMAAKQRSSFSPNVSLSNVNDGAAVSNDVAVEEEVASGEDEAAPYEQVAAVSSDEGAGQLDVSESAGVTEAEVSTFTDSVVSGDEDEGSSYVSSEDEGEFSSGSDEDAFSSEEEGDRSEPARGGFGFFGMMSPSAKKRSEDVVSPKVAPTVSSSGVGGTGAVAPQRELETVGAESDEDAGSTSGGSAGAKDDLFDIPAFLRRK